MVSLSGMVVREVGMKRIAKGCVILSVLLLLVQTLGFAADKGIFSVTPKLKNGAKWRLGYYQGGDYPDYQASLTATVRALMDLG